MTAQGRDVTAPHLPRLLLGSTQAAAAAEAAHLPPPISLQGRRRGEGERGKLIFFWKIRFYRLGLILFYFFGGVASLRLCGQRRRPLVRGSTTSSSRDSARLPRRRPSSSDPWSDSPGQDLVLVPSTGLLFFFPLFLFEEGGSLTPL